MDMNDKDKVELEKGNEEPLSYHPSGVSPNWRYEIPNFGNSSIGLVSSGNSMAVCGDAVGPSCSSGSMVDSFGPTIWEHPVNLAPVGFNEMNLHNGAGVSDPLSMIKSGLFLQGMPGILPSSLSQFATDSAFIERAARFSSFSGGHFGDMLNPLGAHQSGSPYVRGGPMMQGPHEVLSGNLVRHRNSEASLAETSMDVSLPLEHGSVEDNSPKNETAVERSHDEAKRGVSTSGNDSDEPEFSGGIAQEEGGSLTAKTMGPKKRKRGNQDSETEQANGSRQQIGEDRKNNSEIQQRGEQNSTPSGNKSNGKNAKQNQNQNQNPQASDSLKEEYIHVRARRGQATNSHSLAERVRREKISERMKFLQDLVPGCSKVTGKAVMLDEIINYVQSLQRQVEFLSMKLATVNPRLDFNIERLLAKDQMYSTRAGPSTGITFSPDIPMPYPPLNPSQSPILPPGLSGSGNSSDTLRRVISSQLPNMGGGYKDSTLQLPNVWDEELHNVVQMSFNASAPLDNQETNDSVAPGKMKAES